MKLFLIEVHIGESNEYFIIVIAKNKEDACSKTGRNEFYKQLRITEIDANDYLKNLLIKHKKVIK